MAYESPNQETADESLKLLESRYKTMSRQQLASAAVDIASRQIMACTDFKKPRLDRLGKYWELYDGKTSKKLRQIFNVPIPVFPGMIDTLNAQYDTPVRITFREGDSADYFKVKKINAAFQSEIMNTAQASKWDSKLSMVRKHAIINGVGIPKYTASSDPEYKSTLDITNLKHFNFQPKGGMYLENHLFAGEENIEKTKAELVSGALAGEYDMAQVKLLIKHCEDANYLPFDSTDMATKLSRFKPLGLDPDNHSYVGQPVYRLAQHILEIDGKRWFLVFHPWSRTWLRFEPWSEINSSDEYPWKPYHTHEDDENFLSKSFGDDLYAAADAIVALFNQELTNREKRNFGARAYDKDMFTDVRKLDEAMHRPDALVPADTKGGTRRISEGIYEFQVGELGGTVNLIDWLSDTLGRNTGANDLSMGSVQEVSKKASVTFAEQKSTSKRIGWGSQSFQTMMGDIGRAYIYGLKDHMPAKMAIRILGEEGEEWDEITRMDLNTNKDIDVLISSTDQQAEESDIKAARREKALSMVLNSPNINPQKRDEEILRSIGDFSEQETAEFLDTKTFSDRKSIAKASEAIQMIRRGKTPALWYGATPAFIQKIVDFAVDKRETIGDDFDKLIDYAVEHKEIAMDNIERKILEQNEFAAAAQAAPQQPMQSPTPQQAPQPANGQLPAGVQRAMNIAELAQ